MFTEMLQEMEKLKQTEFASTEVWVKCLVSHWIRKVKEKEGSKKGLSHHSAYCDDHRNKMMGLLFSNLLLTVNKTNRSKIGAIHPRYSTLKKSLIEIQRYTVNQEATFKKRKTVLMLETQKKYVKKENTTEIKAAMLIEERHKCSNDVETNPGPQKVNFEELVNFVKFAPSKQKISKKRICQLIINTHEDAMNRKIPMRLYTENNLITIQNIWALSISQKYQPEVRDKMDNLLRHFYDKVKEQEVKKKPMGKKQTQKKATIVATLKKEAATQFPEKLVNGVDESEDAATKENNEAIPVSRELNPNVRKNMKNSGRERGFHYQ